MKRREDMGIYLCFESSTIYEWGGPIKMHFQGRERWGERRKDTNKDDRK
jgi:hypothetical protein